MKTERFGQLRAATLRMALRVAGCGGVALLTGCHHYEALKVHVVDDDSGKPLEQSAVLTDHMPGFLEFGAPGREFTFADSHGDAIASIATERRVVWVVASHERYVAQKVVVMIDRDKPAASRSDANREQSRRLNIAGVSISDGGQGDLYTDNKAWFVAGATNAVEMRLTPKRWYETIIVIPKSHRGPIAIDVLGEVPALKSHEHASRRVSLSADNRVSIYRFAEPYMHPKYVITERWEWDDGTSLADQPWFKDEPSLPPVTIWLSPPNVPGLVRPVNSGVFVGNRRSAMLWYYGRDFD